MEKVLDNQELMKCIKGDPVIYACSSKDFETAWKKKNAWKKMSSALGVRYYTNAKKV